MRWALILQHYRFTVRAINGSQKNVVRYKMVLLWYTTARCTMVYHGSLPWNAMVYHGIPWYDHVIIRGLQRSRADDIREKLDAVSGDAKSTWRVARSLLHMDHKAVHNDSDCQKLVSTFSQFFTDKVSKIRANPASALKSSTRRQFATRPTSVLRCRHSRRSQPTR